MRFGNLKFGRSGSVLVNVSWQAATRHWVDAARQVVSDSGLDWLKRAGVGF